MTRNGSQFVNCNIKNYFDMKKIKEDLVSNYNKEISKNFFNNGIIQYNKLLDLYDNETVSFMVEANLIYMEKRFCKTDFNCTIFENMVIFSDPDIPDKIQKSLYVDPLWDKYLSKLLIRHPVERSLDMGGGAGIISFVLSKFSKEVYYVDINPRAICFAKLNAMINGINNVHFIESNLFSNVPKVLFDYIVFNSPTNKEGKLCKRLLEAGESILSSFFSLTKTYLSNNGICQVSMGIFDEMIDAYEKINKWGQIDKNRKLYLIMKSKIINLKKWKRLHLTFVNSEGKEKKILFSYNKLPDSCNGKICGDFISELLFCD